MIKINLDTLGCICPNGYVINDDVLLQFDFEITYNPTGKTPTIYEISEELEKLYLRDHLDDVIEQACGKFRCVSDWALVGSTVEITRRGRATVCLLANVESELSDTEIEGETLVAEWVEYDGSGWGLDSYKKMIEAKVGLNRHGHAVILDEYDQVEGVLMSVSPHELNSVLQNYIAKHWNTDDLVECDINHPLAYHRITICGVERWYYNATEKMEQEEHEEHMALMREMAD